MTEETWTPEDEAAWQAAQPIIRKHNRLYMKKRRDKQPGGRHRRYARSENKSSVSRAKGDKVE